MNKMSKMPKMSKINILLMICLFIFLIYIIYVKLNSEPLKAKPRQQPQKPKDLSKMAQEANKEPTVVIYANS